MKQRLIAVLAVMALFAGLLALGTGQVFARDGEDEMKPTGTPPTNMMPGKRSGEAVKELVRQEVKEKVMDEDKDGGTSFGIKPSGEVIIQKGKVTASTNSSVTVTVLGFPVSVTWSASSTVQNGTSTTFAAGDVLNIRGMIDPATGIITAKTIRNDTAQNQAAEGIRAQIQRLMDQLRGLKLKFQ